MIKARRLPPAYNIGEQTKGEKPFIFKDGRLKRK